MANKGKFINTTRRDDINTLVDSAKKILNNPFYVWANRSPTIVTYYNINKEMSTLDEGLKDIMSYAGQESPLWFNIVNNFFIYGIEQIQIQIENGEFGAASSDITGEGFILPGSIIPYTGDHFKIGYIKEDFVFRVTGVSHDTLENGSNIYKIQYKLETGMEDDSKIKIKDTYDFIPNNVGTGYNSILRSEKVNLIEALEWFLYRLRNYYINTFYNDRVQAFTYRHKGYRFYDPYMTQFLINNKILNGGDDYIYITHQLPLRNYFPVAYDRTFFRFLELKDTKNIRRYKNDAISRFIDNQENTIFGTRPEDYFEIEFRHENPESSFFGIIPCFPDRLIEHIESNNLFDGDDIIYNTIVKYLNDRDLSSNDIDILDFDIHNNLSLFYTIPCIIFCLESCIKRMMLNREKIIGETYI